MPSLRAPERSWMPTFRPDGFLNVLKPPAMTSHDVVAMVRRRTGLKVGHSGTLDPAAAGVLVLCLGAATRLAGYVVGLPKSYRGEITFGVATSTGDAEGIVSQRAMAPDLRAEDVAAALKSMTGTIPMTPPAFSAVHVDGRRAYEAAREGETPELQARAVTLYSLRSVRLEHEPTPRLLIDVTCSAGTYIRVLAEMIGDRLGCHATLTALVRTRVGHFVIEDAVAPDRIETGDLDGLVVPPADGLVHLPAVTLDDVATRSVLHGNRIAAPPVGVEAGHVRLLDAAGGLICVGEIVNDAGNPEIQPRTVLPA